VKEEIRAEIRRKLKEQSRTDRDRKSSVITGRLEKDILFQRAKTILFYVSTDEEVETYNLIRTALQNGKRVAVPFIDNASNGIQASFIQNADEDLAPGSYGILEPKTKSTSKALLSEIELVLVPGLAFDHAKHRLGRGKGYYDRFLAKLPRHVKTYGLAFDFQIVEQLPVTELDVPMHRVIHN
jgi:5-formyltetrahydrofolate cyclo-ligase